MEGNSMAEKMDKQPAAPTLPVSVDVEEQQQQPPRAARPPFLHIDVQLVNLWTFSNAVGVTIGFLAYYTLIVTHYLSQPSWLLLRAAAKMTDAEDTQISALMIGMQWCNTPQQATAAALALLLPSHRWRIRRATAYAALTLTVASHCMYAGVVGVIVRADPGRILFAICGSAVIFMCLVFDVLCFLALLRVEWAN